MGRKDEVERLVARFGRWLPGEADPEDLGNLDLFLSVRRDYLDAAPCTWHEGDITELLLGVFPRKVQKSLVNGPAVLAGFLQFLKKNGELRGSGLHQLQAELAEVAPQFAPAMQDSSRFGMAKTLTAAMVDDGVAIDGPAAPPRRPSYASARCCPTSAPRTGRRRRRSPTLTFRVGRSPACRRASG